MRARRDVAQPRRRPQLPRRAERGGGVPLLAVLPQLDGGDVHAARGDVARRGVDVVGDVSVVGVQQDGGRGPADEKPAVLGAVASEVDEVLALPERQRGGHRGDRPPPAARPAWTAHVARRWHPQQLHLVVGLARPEARLQLRLAASSVVPARPMANAPLKWAPSRAVDTGAEALGGPQNMACKNACVLCFFILGTPT